MIFYHMRFLIFFTYKYLKSKAALTELLYFYCQFKFVDMLARKLLIFFILISFKILIFAYPIILLISKILTILSLGT